MYINDNRDDDKDNAMARLLAMGISDLIFQVRDKEPDLDDAVAIDALGRVLTCFVGDICCEEHLEDRLECLTRALRRGAREFFNRKQERDTAAESAVAAKH
jgi:hypothetical protein